jgi:hypothetical protein
MAELADEGLTGVLRDWLAAARPALNNRFRLAARRFPRLDPEAVLALCRDLLPPLAAEPHANLPALLDAVFDLILLHSGRGTLTREADGHAQPISVLLRETFRQLRPYLLARPRFLPGALSNATENLGQRGLTFARTLPAVAAHLTDAEQLPTAGAFLAWRLGDARLRAAVLAAPPLPPGALLAALGVSSWPVAAAPLLLTALATDGWRTPERLFSAATLEELAGNLSAERLEELRRRAGVAASAPPGKWELIDRVGNFRGFEGAFDEPPLLLVETQTTRHCLWARSGSEVYRVDADAFGWVCSLAAPSEQPPCPAKRPRGLAVPKEATSVLSLPDLAAYTRPDSFRIRLLAPPREPL